MPQSASELALKSNHNGKIAIADQEWCKMSPTPEVVARPAWPYAGAFAASRHLLSGPILSGSGGDPISGIYGPSPTGTRLPQTPLRQALADAVEWFRAHGYAPWRS